MPKSIVDFKTLELKLLDAFVRCFADFSKKYSKDSIYSYGAYTTPSLGYIIPTVSTEAGLAKVAAKYKKSKHYSAKSVATLKRELRWSPPDSPLHGKGDAFFKSTEKPLLQLEKELDKIDDDGPYFKLLDKGFDALFNALIKANEAGTFGSGKERSRLVLNVWYGDQDQRMLFEVAKLLNPPDVVRRFKKEYKDSQRD